MYHYMYTGCIYWILEYAGIPILHLQYKYYIKVTKTGALMQLSNLENEIYYVQYGVFLTKCGHKLLLSLSAQPDYVWKSWKNNC